MTARRTFRAAVLVGFALVSTVPVIERAHATGATCTPSVLSGLYVFSASGFIVPASGPAQPKTVLELIRFNGDGTLAVPGAAVSLNGAINLVPPGGTGTYTVADLNPPDGVCGGTLTFLPNGPHFAIVIPLDAQGIWMFQTDANNVFQGTATLVSR